MPKEFYIRIKSDDSKNSHTSNGPASFTVDLPIKIRLLGGMLKCAVSEITIPRVVTQSNKGHIHIFSDITTDSIINDKMMNVMRRFPILKKKGSNYWSFTSLEYIRLKKTIFDDIHIHLTFDDLSPVEFEADTVSYITLHFMEDRH
jgi:hypothetical protein